MQVTKDATTALQAAIIAGKDPTNCWTSADYGVAQAVAPLVRDGVCSLERANEELVLEGFDPMGPDLLPFVWGPITTIHRVGGHAIVEYTKRDSFIAAEGRMGGGGEQAFSVYTTVDGEMRRTSRGADSLDMALLKAIVYAAEARAHGVNAAANEQLTGYLRRMLEL